MSRRCVTQLVAAAMLLCGRAAGAQYASAAGLHRATTAETALGLVAPSAVMVEGSRLHGAARGALIGTAVGAAVGMVVVVATPHSDHSEDAVGPIIGAFFGLVVGGAIGAAHPR